MGKQTKGAFFAGLLLLVMLPTAQASFFNLSYTLTAGGLLEAELEGNLQIDGNTVIITAINDAQFNGAPTPGPLNFFDSLSNLDISSGLPPRLSLDGSSALDFIACFTPACFGGFLFDTVIFNPPNPIFLSSPFFGSAFEPLNGSYSLEAVQDPQAVPEPQIMPLFLISVLVLGCMRRRYEHPSIRRTPTFSLNPTLA